MLLAVYEPCESITLVVTREYYFVDFVPLRLAIVARSATQLHLPSAMVYVPIPSPKTRVTRHHEMTMQSDHPKPEMTVLGNDEFRISQFLVLSFKFSVHVPFVAMPSQHTGLNHPQSAISVPNAPRLKVFFTQMGMCFSATGLMVGA